MENTKAKKIIIGVLLILLLACLGVIVWQYIRLNTQIENNNNLATEKENKESSNTDVTDVEEVVDNTKKEDNNNNETVDPYAKYKDIKWSTTSDTIKESVKIEIKNKVVYVTWDNETNKISGIKGTPKKVVAYINGGIATFRVLTEEGKVYGFADYGTTTAKLIEELDNIEDMTRNAKGEVAVPVYYLTKDGKLIDSEKNTFEELNKDFIGSYGHFYPIYFDSNSYVYYPIYDESKEDISFEGYEVVKDSNKNKIVANKVFWQTSTISNDLADKEISERFVVLTEDNQLIYINMGVETEKDTITRNSQKVKEYNTKKVYSEESEGYIYNVVFTMEDGTKITIKDINSYYNVKEGKRVDF